MEPESRSSSSIDNGSVNIPAETNTCNNRRAAFSMIRSVSIARQRRGKHISAAVNQFATIEEAVFSVGVTPRLYNEDLRQLRDRTLCGGGVEYLHRIPVSRRKRRKGNSVPGGIIGHPIPGGYEYRDLALQIGGTSSLRQ
jgi:hypothetical protein